VEALVGRGAAVTGRGRHLVRWGPAVVALALALAAYAPGLHPDRRLAGRDLLLLFEPLHRRVAAAWREGRVIERDATRGCGTPTLPDPLAQVFYPPALVRAALPFELGWALWFPLHAALAGAGAARLARALGASPRGACLAAAGGALAGPLLSACRTPNLLAGAAWTPWALAGFVELATGTKGRASAPPPGPTGSSGPGKDVVGVGGGALARLLSGARERTGSGRRQARAAALSALAVGMIVLAGGVPILVLLAPGVGALLLAMAWDRPADLARGAARVAGATALGAALAGVHLVPFTRFLRETPRASGLSLEAASQWSMHPLRAVEFLVPGLTPQTSDAWFTLLRRSFHPFEAPLHNSVHLGAPIVLLAAMALLRARADRRVLGLGLACALWLVVALGAYTPLFAPLRALPLFGDWRFPEKGLLPLAVVLPALAGLGLRALAPHARMAAFTATVVLLLAGTLADPTVVATLPRALVDGSGVARDVLAAEAARPAPGAPGRYLRVARSRWSRQAMEQAPDAAAKVELIRASQVEVLQEDLPGRFGIDALVAYGPMVNKRLGPYLETTALRDEAGHVVGFDLPRLADEACVAHVLQDDLRLVHQAVPSRARLVEGRGRVRTLSHGPERLEVAVDLETPGRLYVAEGFFPGWQATTSTGAALEVEPAKGLFLSVALPAGTYQLTLVYRTPGLALGAGVSALALVLLAGLYLRR
jgi:hypothetical protein